MPVFVYNDQGDALGLGMNDPLGLWRRAKNGYEIA